MNRARLADILAALGIAFASMGFVGLTILGAIVAPLVFRIVPAPGSADAMTAVFERYDIASVILVSLLAIIEAAHGTLRAKVERADLARVALLVALLGTTLLEALIYTPRIAQLHQGGAIRGLGDAGFALEAAHRIAEKLGKTSVLLFAFIAALHARTLIVQRRATTESHASS